jgi:hypothetical protein
VHRLRPERRGGVCPRPPNPGLDPGEGGSACSHATEEWCDMAEKEGRVWCGRDGGSGCWRLIRVAPSLRCFAVMQRVDHMQVMPSGAGANARRKAAAKSLSINAGASGFAGTGSIRPPSPGSGPGYGAAHRAPAIPKAGCRVSALRVTIRRAENNALLAGGALDPA